MPVKYKPWSIENEKTDLWGFELLEGEFAGTTIAITSLSMEDSNDGSIALDFTVFKQPEGQEIDTQSDNFNEALSGVVNDILTKAVNEFKDRDSNSTKSGKR
jgi:hypothetical protein